MARAPRNHAAEYARRVAKGRAAGLTRQQARGHLPREKARTAAKQRAAGELTETDRRFLRRQLSRTSDYYEARRTGTGRVEYVVTETRADRYARAAAAYKALTPGQRDALRAKQADLARSYRSSKKGGAYRRDLDYKGRAPNAGARGREGFFGGGAVPAGGIEAPDFFGDGAVAEPDPDDPDVFDYDYYDELDDWPDMDDALSVLFFYH